jgi:hypothetical protein
MVADTAGPAEPGSGRSWCARRTPADRVLRLDPPHAELAGLGVAGVIRDLRDGPGRPFRSSWKSMNSGIRCPPLPDLPAFALVADSGRGTIVNPLATDAGPST